MAFDARARAQELVTEKYPPFEFIGMDGEQYHFPHPMMVPGDIAAAAQAGEITADEFLAKLVPGAWEAVEAMPPGVQAELMAEWQATVDEQVTEQGKERSPSSGQNRAARRSKPTSRPAAKKSGASRSGGSRARSKS